MVSKLIIKIISGLTNVAKNNGLSKSLYFNL